MHVAGCVASWKISLHAMLGIIQGTSDLTFDVLNPKILHVLCMKIKDLTESMQKWIECIDFLYCQNSLSSHCQYLCFKTHYSDKKVVTFLLQFPWEKLISLENP